jgi:hypothetical protein
MATIGAHALITEVNRYEFTIEVDDNLTVEEQKIQGREKLSKFLEDNTPYVFQAKPISGVTCVDCDSSYKGTDIPDVIEIN